MFSPSSINQALNHQANFHKGEFSDEEVSMLCQYWRHLLEITNGVDGLRLISSYAAYQLHSIQLVLDARGLPTPRSYECELIMQNKALNSLYSVDEWKEGMGT